MFRVSRRRNLSQDEYSNLTAVLLLSCSSRVFGEGFSASRLGRYACCNARRVSRRTINAGNGRPDDFVVHRFYPFNVDSVTSINFCVHVRLTRAYGITVFGGNAYDLIRPFVVRQAVGPPAVLPIREVLCYYRVVFMDPYYYVGANVDFQFCATGPVGEGVQEWRAVRFFDGEGYVW